MKNRRYTILSLLLCLIGIPLALQIIGIAGILSTAVFPAAPLFVIGLGGMAVLFLIWRGVAKWDRLPGDALSRYAPIGIALAANLLLFMFAFGLAGFQFGSRAFQNALLIGGFPWFAVSFACAFVGDYTLYPVVQVAVYGLCAGMLGLCCRRQKHPATRRIRGMGLLGAMVLLCLVCGGQFFLKSRAILAADYSVARVKDEVSLYEYEPFRADNRLIKLDAAPTLVIRDHYPRLDGATAAYPVYGAMAQAVYAGLDADSASVYVACSQTNEAYERLTRGDVDILFGAQPSGAQIADAAARGVEFHLTPIAREAFVFFVNRDNPVQGLTVGQIQDIYQKKITNWKDVGGDDRAIMPFQRPENSGSQTIMQRVMAGKALPKPLMEEYAAGMGGVINAVAAYRNYSGAIGYSFRFFATGMNPNPDIQLIPVDGIAPTVESIRSESYPFTVNVYAVTTKPPEGNVKALIDWALSQQGQKLIEDCGYVGLK